MCYPPRNRRSPRTVRKSNSSLFFVGYMMERVGGKERRAPSARSGRTAVSLARSVVPSGIFTLRPWAPMVPHFAQPACCSPPLPLDDLTLLFSTRKGPSTAGRSRRGSRRWPRCTHAGYSTGARGVLARRCQKAKLQKRRSGARPKLGIRKAKANPISGKVKS